MKHRLLLLLVSVLVVAIAPGRADTAKSFAIGYTGASLYPLYDIAQENHYFADEGVTVDLRQYPSPDMLVQAVVTREVSAGILPTAEWQNAITAGIPLTIIAGQQRQGYQLITTKAVRKSLTGLEKVAARSVGIITGTTSNTVYRATLAYAGLPAALNDRLRAFASQEALLHAIHTGTVAVGIIDDTVTLGSKDLVTFSLPSEAHAFRTTAHLVVPSAAQDDKGYRKLLAALLRSQAYLQANTAQAISLVRTRHPDIDHDTITRAIATATLHGDRDGILARETLQHHDGVATANSKLLSHINLEPYHQALLDLTTRFPYEGYYPKQLFALGDYSIIPDCCR